MVTLTVKTQDLQDLVNKVGRCVSNNKLIPITSFIGLKVLTNREGKRGLVLVTTDATNFFYVWSEDEVDCEEFDIAVEADTFINLVKKTTSENITLSISDDDKVLTIKGNGTYKMERQYDMSVPAQPPVKFPMKVTTWEDLGEPVDVVKVDVIKNAINVNRAAVATDMQHPALTAYYCGDAVITSNRKTVCKSNTQVFKTPELITPVVMDLLSSLSSEEFSVYNYEGANVYVTRTDLIYAPKFSDVDMYPIHPIEELINQEFKSVCTIPRASVLNILDRISLFVGAYDKKSITMTFTPDGVMFNNKKSSGTEIVPYIDVMEFMSFTCHINIEYLRDQLASQDSDQVELYYGSDKAIKLVSGGITQIIALLKDEEVK